MAYYNQAGPFWDFVRSLDAGRTEGEGVDRAPRDSENFEHSPFPFGFGPEHRPPFGRRGHGPGPHGRHGEGEFGPFGGPGPHGRHHGGEFRGFGGPGPHGRHHGGEFRGFGGPGPHGKHGGFGKFGGPGGPHGKRHGGRGRHDRQEEGEERASQGSRSRSPQAERSGSQDDEKAKSSEDRPHPRGYGRHGRRHSRDSFKGESSDEHPRSRGGPHRGPHGPYGPYERHGRGGMFGGRGFGGRGHRGPPFGGPAGGPFDMSALAGALSSHPIAQAFQTYAQQSGLGGEAAERSGETLVPAENQSTFAPPVDIFSIPSAYILHAAIPGAKKEDVGVNWDADKDELNIAGVVYRQGDEDFLNSLSQAERKVGVFERSVKLPVGEEKEEVDGDAIVAKLEDGVLVVTVPKVEKEWTDVKRIDIN